MNNNFVNFLRTGVGIESVHHLYDIQQTYRRMEDGSGAFLTTRRTPTRANEIINGGSVYWIIKRQICARQEVIDIQTLQDDAGKNFCLILMDPQIILTSPVAHRHIQGWRYLPIEKAPKDLRPFDPTEVEDDDIDPKMAKELAEIGLL
jgi:hypothetical protein